MSEKDIQQQDAQKQSADETAEQEPSQIQADIAEAQGTETAETAEAETQDSKQEPEFVIDPFDPFHIPEEVESLIVEKIESEVKARSTRQSRRSEEGASEDSEETVSRRRRRRRRGDDDLELIGGDDEDPPNTITRVRSSRPIHEGTGPENVTAVKGSTRLEAKRQRRRESRDGGRRRTVITEAEFLARRESVERKMVVREKEDRIQIGVLEDGILAEHFVSNTQQDSLIGNVYVGKVQNVLPSMEAAFIDIGRGRNAVLYAGEVNWDTVKLDGKPRRIENALKGGDTVLVQVSKDPVGHKGARLTSQISLPGRYLVYVPDGSMTGISRKLPDVERARLKKILKDHLPADAGVIVRTAAEGASEEELTNDINRLRVQWEGIKEKANSNKTLAPELLYAEPDLTIKVVRDVFNEDFSKLIVSGENTWDQIEAYVTYVAPDLVGRLEKWESEEDIFSHFRIDEQINKALERKVFLPSGGSLVIDRTEAMTVVDVNTGKFTGSGGNLEETVTKNNLEAAEEVVRQLRLRDIGGIIVIDFIDMVLESNRDLVLRRLVECLGRDRTKHQVAEVTSLGLVQMTRKRMGTGLLEVFGELCPECAGRGMVTHEEPIIHRRPLAPVPSSKTTESPRAARAERRGRRKGRGHEGEQQGHENHSHDHESRDHSDHGHAETAAESVQQRAEKAPHADAASEAAQAAQKAEAAESPVVSRAVEPEAAEQPQEAQKREETQKREEAQKPEESQERETRSSRGGRRNDRADRSERNDRTDRNERSDRGSDRSGRGRQQSERGGSDRNGGGNGGGNDRQQGRGRGGRPQANVLVQGTRLAPGSLAPKDFTPAVTPSSDEPKGPAIEIGDAKVELPRGRRTRGARAPQVSLDALDEVFEKTEPREQEKTTTEPRSARRRPARAEAQAPAASEAPARTAPARTAPVQEPQAQAAPAAAAETGAAPARRRRRVAVSAQGAQEVAVVDRTEAKPVKAFVASVDSAAAARAAQKPAAAPVMLGVGVSAEEIARANKA